MKKIKQTGKKQSSPNSLTTSNSPEVAKQYINDVLDGKILVCKWVKLFCQRHVKDLANCKERGLYFDEKAGARILKFFDFLKHSKGEFAGKQFVLSAWQQAYLYVLFGWKNEDNTRRFRTSYMEVSRKNGKSTMAAGVALYLLAADGEQGAEVYSAATKRDQAKIVHSEAVRMVKASKALRSLITVRAQNMYIEKTNSKYEPLSSDRNTLDGLNISGVIIDELHAHATRDLWEILETAMGARKQPLIFAITTAGESRMSVCREKHEYLEKILEGTVDDDTFCGIIFTLDEGDDYTNPEVWIKANPNLYISVNYDFIAKELKQAREMPAKLNSFLRMLMNQWTQVETRWINPEKWNLCKGGSDIDMLHYETCYGGLDLSSVNDLSAFVLKFPRTGDVLAWFWIPEDNMQARERRDRVPFSTWVRQGFVEATPGNVIDYEYIKQRIRDIARDFPALREIGYDPFMATQIALQLEEEGFNMVTVRQGMLTLSPAMKELEREYLSGELKHRDNPILKWMAANVVAKTDRAGNYMPDKGKSTDRIDGIAALCMAISRQINAYDSLNIYEERGLLFV